MSASIGRPRSKRDAKVMTGSDNVIIGGDPQQTLPIQSEVPEWLYKVSDLTLLFAGLLVHLAANGLTDAHYLADHVSGYEAALRDGTRPPSFDKDVIRSWVGARCDPYKDPIPEIPRIRLCRSQVSPP